MPKAKKAKLGERHLKAVNLMRALSDPNEEQLLQTRYKRSTTPVVCAATCRAVPTVLCR